QNEPTVTLIDDGASIVRSQNFDLVIGIGGGSAIDTGKALAGLATNPGSVMDYLEGVGTGAEIQQPPLPYLAIPTTAGTGAEVTKNAVIASPEHKFKKSMRSPLLLPRIALVDPELTLTLPPEPTAFSGMDALTQCIEAYTSKKSQPFTDILALEGIRLARRSLRVAFRDGQNLAAREAMSLCSLLSGMALANAGLGAAHGVGAALGALFEIPHGLACAVMLPPVMQANYQSALEKYARVGEILTEKTFSSPEEAAKAGIEFIYQLRKDLKIPESLGALGITSSDVPLLAKNSGGSSMNGNPRQFREEELMQLLNNLI
ncbi:iron-containing alcohol dehydrogenase, partial [candidate division KSB1 bacterium]|nr:iron-containing alcohol dehydrogenase [candidate division KSB1 bacterium]